MGGAVFKTVMAWLNPGPVGSIPTRPRHSPGQGGRIHTPVLRPALAALVACTGCAATAPAGTLDPVPAAPAVAAASAVATARGPDPVRELPVIDSARAAGVALPLATAHGEATYYADRFDGRLTASGRVFRQSAMLAAHRDYPFGTVLRVTNLANGRTVEVRVVDRLPPARTDRARRTVLDVSRGAAERLDFVRAGRVPVRLEVLEWGDGG